MGYLDLAGEALLLARLRLRERDLEAGVRLRLMLRGERDAGLQQTRQQPCPTTPSDYRNQYGTHMIHRTEQYS